MVYIENRTPQKLTVFCLVYITVRFRVMVNVGVRVRVVVVFRVRFGFRFRVNLVCNIGCVRIEGQIMVSQ